MSGGFDDPAFFTDHVNPETKTNGHFNGHGLGHVPPDPEPQQRRDNPAPEAILCEQLVPVPIHLIPPRPWAYGHFLLFGHASVIGAVDGGGKGANAIAIALSMISGKTLLNERVWRTGPIAIITYEDDKDEWLRRIAVACLHYPELDYNTVCRGFYFITRPRGQVTLAAHLATGRGGVIFPDGDEIIALLKNIGAVLLIIDPFNHAHALDDGNSNVMVAKLAGEIARIAAEAKVAALVLHHLRKGSNGSIDDLMGATALRATFRSARILMRMTGEEAKALRVEPEDAFRYIRLADSKENYTPPPDRSTWYKLESVALDNGADIYPDGDNVAVLTPWTPPPSERLPKAAIAQIFDAFRRGPAPGEHYSPNANARGDWAGNPIITIGEVDEAEAARWLRDWLKSKTLIEGTYRSPKRRRFFGCVTLNEAKAQEILGALYHQPPGVEES